MNQKDSQIGVQQQFAIKGMTCQACASRLEKVLQKNPAVESAQVNFATETLSIRHRGGDTDEVLAWIKKVGFEGRLVGEESTHEQGVPYSLWLLWLLSVPFWLGMLGMMVGSHALMPVLWVQFVLASVVQFVFGWRFYQGAWASLRGGLANMDVLVALGTTAIWAYSTYVWLTKGGLGAHGAVYFEASVMIIAFVSLGKYLERRTKQESLDGLSALMDLVPQTVLRQSSAGWQKTDLRQVRVGDVLLARVGERIAVDGVLTAGKGMLDEAHLTGESAHLFKDVGDTVLAGSIVTDGGFEYQARLTGDETALSEMISALHEAQGSKADIARLADRVSAVFVPVVVSLAVAVFLANWLWLGSFEMALMRAVSVLAIACPCALGLATPAAIMAGMGLAAKHGIRFKDAPSLEVAGRIDVMAFDKTGTLTLGRPIVRASWVADGWRDDEALAIAASVEQHATHPLAASIVKKALDKGLSLYPVHEVDTVVGQGLSGVIEGVGMVKVGSPAFVGADEMALMASLLSDSERIHADGDVHLESWQACSVVAVLVDNALIAAYALSDAPKRDAKEVVSRLQTLGAKVMILSGDRQAVVDAVAADLGVSWAYGGLSPKDKALKINELKERGSTVAMIGDGVNDAPAMAAAQASFSVHDASGVAKYAASAELMGDSLLGAYHAHLIAKATLTTIKQNLFFAFIYNVFGIGLAAVGLLSPIIAAAAMALSSMCVLGNALRLKRLSLTDA